MGAFLILLAFGVSLSALAFTGCRKKIVNAPYTCADITPDEIWRKAVYTFSDPNNPIPTQRLIRERVVVRFSDAVNPVVPKISMNHDSTYSCPSGETCDRFNNMSATYSLGSTQITFSDLATPADNGLNYALLNGVFEIYCNGDSLIVYQNADPPNWTYSKRLSIPQ